MRKSAASRYLSSLKSEMGVNSLRVQSWYANSSMRGAQTTNILCQFLACHRLLQSHTQPSSITTQIDTFLRLRVTRIAVKRLDCVIDCRMRTAGQAAGQHTSQLLRYGGWNHANFIGPAILARAYVRSSA